MEKDYLGKIIGGNYVILPYDRDHKLGQGSFANVYLCRKYEDGKLMPTKYVAKEIYIQRKIQNMQSIIQREIDIMLQLTGDTSLMVKIYDYFNNSENKCFYIIMDYCEGGDLEKYTIENGPLTEEMIASLLHPVAKFFDIIHKRGIIHRDLKLANVLIYKKIVKGEEPELKITDFGLARTLEDEGMAFTTCGTPVYMAPEIWNRDKKGYSNKIDVWAFGNMLYSMMYGEYPFEGMSVEKKIQLGKIRFTKLRLASLEALDLMIKCLRKNPKERPSFEEIYEHPFFSKKEFEPFMPMFDGYFGYLEVDINNSYDLLKDPNCFGLPEKPTGIFDKHNEEVLKEWAKLGLS